VNSGLLDSRQTTTFFGRKKIGSDLSPSQLGYPRQGHCVVRRLPCQIVFTRYAMIFMPECVRPPRFAFKVRRFRSSGAFALGHRPGALPLCGRLLLLISCLDKEWSRHADPGHDRYPCRFCARPCPGRYLSLLSTAPYLTEHAVAAAGSGMSCAPRTTGDQVAQIVPVLSTNGHIAVVPNTVAGKTGCRRPADGAGGCAACAVARAR